MTCPRCGADHPPIDRREPRLHCDRCGARLFAWLGDPFGTRDAAVVAPARGEGMVRTPPRGAAPGDTDWIAIALLALALFLLLSCACLTALAR